MDKTKELGTEPVGKLLLKYSIPSIIAMIVNAIYNVVDRIFIGNFAGEEALGGLTIAFPVMMIIFAFASLIGAGGAALLSIKLGENDRRGASHVFGNSLGLGIIITGITLIVVYLNLEGLLGLFGATPELLGYAKDYMSIILAGFIFQMLSFILNSSVRTEGFPLLSMAAMMTSAVMNIILDWVFIVRLGWGVQGAALATIIGQFTGFCLLLSFYLRKKSSLSPKLRDFIPEWNIARLIVVIGFATFIGTLGNSLAMTFLNRALVEYGGNAAITSMGAVNSLFTFFIMPIMGLQQGMQPIIGYNHGARLKERTWGTFKIAAAIGIIFSVVVFAILQLFSEGAVSLFLDSSSPTIGVAAQGLRMYILSLPVLSLSFLGIAYFQSTAQGTKSLLLSLLRQFFLLIPIVLVLPSFLGLGGVWLATPIADYIAVIITVIALVAAYRKEKKSGFYSEPLAA